MTMFDSLPDLPVADETLTRYEIPNAVAQHIDRRHQPSAVAFMRKIADAIVHRAEELNEIAAGEDEPLPFDIDPDGSEGIKAQLWGQDLLFGAAKAGGAIRARNEMNQRIIELERRTMTDPLTGLLNRRGWELGLAEFGKDTTLPADGDKRGIKTQAVVMMIDLDDFKKNINDVIGQSGGDKVLVEVARRLKAIFRKGDWVARLGGDEFGVLVRVPTTDPSMVTDELIEAMRIKVQDDLVGEHITDEDVAVGFSSTVGAALIIPGEDPAEALDRADGQVKEMKSRKKIGR